MTTSDSTTRPETSGALPPARALGDLLSKGTVVIGAAAYVVGFLIVNIHMARFGVSQIDLLRSDYILTGCAWALLAYIVILLPAGALRGVLTAVGRSKHRGSRSEAATARFVAWAIGAWIALLVFDFLADGQVQMLSWAGLRIIGIIFLNGIVIANLIAVALEMATEHSNKASNASDLLALWVKSFLNILLFALAIFLYASYVFPQLSPIFGGGRAREILMVMEVRGVPVAKAAGVEIQAGSRIVPLDLIFEDSVGFVVRRRSQGKHSVYPVFRVPRDLVDGIVYSKPKRGV
jgi:hypothetical protein